LTKALTRRVKKNSNINLLRASWELIFGEKLLKEGMVRK